MTERIVHHVLEIIRLLTGEASFLQHLTKSLKIKEMNNDKKVTEKILNHALEIISLLTGECDVNGRKELIDEKHQHLSTLGNPSNRRFGPKDEAADILTEEEDELDEKDILQVTIRSSLCEGLQDENLTESINEEGEYERSEKDVQQRKLHSDPHAGTSRLKPSVFPKREQEEAAVIGHQEIKEEELPVNINNGLSDENLHIVSINEDGQYRREENSIQQVEISSDPHAGRFIVRPSKLDPKDSDVRNDQEVKEEEIPINICKKGRLMSRNTDGHRRSSHTSIHFVIRDIGVAEGCQEAIQLNNIAYNYGSKSVLNVDKEVNSPTEVSPMDATTSTKKHQNIIVMKNSTECGENSLSTNPQIPAHQTSLTGDKPFVCSECGQSFIYKSYLVRHQQSHMIEKPFKCSECGKCFIYSSSLVKHQKSQMREKPFRCTECGKCFTHKSAFVAHERLHKGVKLFACSVCGKCFRKKSNLAYHESSHTGVKPFACSQCGKCFTQMSDCVTHERIHTGVKPFACSECGKCFSKKAYLVCHERIHTGVKPFTCSECGKCFNQKSHLVYHERIHTGIKPFACSHCGKCFVSNSACARHQRRHTKKKP